MKDAQSIRESLVDQLMSGETVSKCTFQDILDQGKLAYELTHIWSLPRAEQLTALDDLQAECRKDVGRFVVDHMDDEVNAELWAQHETEYEPRI